MNINRILNHPWKHWCKYETMHTLINIASISYKTCFRLTMKSLLVWPHIHWSSLAWYGDYTCIHADIGISSRSFYLAMLQKVKVRQCHTFWVVMPQPIILHLRQKINWERRSALSTVCVAISAILLQILSPKFLHSSHQFVAQKGRDHQLFAFRMYGVHRSSEDNGDGDGDVVHCYTPSLCYLGAETGYRVGTPYSRM